MGRNSKPKNKIQGGFIAVTYDLLKSAAYRQLGGADLKVLLYAMQKVKGYGHERYETQFAFTYAEAKRYGIPNSTFFRSMSRLHELGFIDVYDRGGLRCDQRTPTLYKLSKRWEHYNTPQFAHRHAGHCETVHGRN